MNRFVSGVVVATLLSLSSATATRAQDFAVTGMDGGFFDVDSMLATIKDGDSFCLTCIDQANSPFTGNPAIAPMFPDPGVIAEGTFLRPRVLINAASVGIFNDSVHRWEFNLVQGTASRRITLEAGEIAAFDIGTGQKATISAIGFLAEDLTAGSLYRLSVQQNLWIVSKL